MSITAYADDSILLGLCHKIQDDSMLREKILHEAEGYTCALNTEGNVFGYHISKNIPLTEIYEFPCYVVKFYFSKADTLHSVGQEKTMCELCARLKKDMEAEAGYYNLRVPAHIVDLVRAVNRIFDSLIFCGGTVEEIHMGNPVEPSVPEGMELFFADSFFTVQNREELERIAYDSFRSYQGQYHISPVTEPKAGKIYQNWIRTYMENLKKNTLFIAKFRGGIAGFCALDEDDLAADARLGCVNEKMRRLGTYRAMLSTLAQYAVEQKKLFISSTQFDNYAVQGVWNSIGLRPFCSVYNMHFDNRGRHAGSGQAEKATQ